jgi:hypothetical protein
MTCQFARIYPSKMSMNVDLGLEVAILAEFLQGVLDNCVPQILHLLLLE